MNTFAKKERLRKARVLDYRGRRPTNLKQAWWSAFLSPPWRKPLFGKLLCIRVGEEVWRHGD